jgi:hypothetical protein
VSREECRNMWTQSEKVPGDWTDMRCRNMRLTQIATKGEGYSEGLQGQVGDYSGVHSNRVSSAEPNACYYSWSSSGGSFPLIARTSFATNSLQMSSEDRARSPS